MIVVRCNPLSVSQLSGSLLALGGLLLLSGCVRQQAAAPNPKAPDATAQNPTVTLTRPKEESLKRVIEQPAHIEAIEETPLLAHISGYVRKVHVDIGDRVQGPRFDDKGVQIAPGQALAEIAVPEMDEELRQRKALVEQAKAEVDQASAAVEAAAAHVATAQALVAEAEAGRERADANVERWQSEHERIKKLAGTVVDQQTLVETALQLKSVAAVRKEVEARVSSAKASVKESEAKRSKSKADLSAARAKVQVAQAEEGRLSALLEYKIVRAPYDGVITLRNVHNGHFLTGAGIKPLFVAARYDTVRVLVDVPEAEASFIREGDKDATPVRVRCQMVKDEEFDGTVTRTSWSLDAKSRTLRVEIHLTNKGGKLRPGMYAYVTFFAALAKTYTLPAAAVIAQGDQTCCYAVDDSSKALRLPVKIGMRAGDDVQVLKKQGPSKSWIDFDGKERIVASNAGSLSDGQAVVVGSGKQ